MKLNMPDNGRASRRWETRQDKRHKGTIARMAKQAAKVEKPPKRGGK